MPPRAALVRVAAITAGLLLAAAAVSFVPPRRATPRSEGKLRVGLVLDIGGRGDKSFNDAAYRGVERAMAELGATVVTIEPASSEDREAGLRLFAAQGMDLVVGVGFIFSHDLDVVARAYPKVRFACIDYAPSAAPPANVSGLAFREEQGSFLVGAVAGLVSKTKHVGFVGGMTIPLIKKFEVGYAAGVAASCPSCVVHVAYAGSTPEAFKDPSKGKSLTVAQIGASADVIFHAAGATGHGVFEAARDGRVFAIGVDSDQHDEMPGTVLTSMVKQVDVALFETIRAVGEGRFKGGMSTFGLREHGVDYVHEGPHGALIPREVVLRVAALRAEVESGARPVPER
ncbi:MAG: BMP family ABC transporter substrate-binding protein [Myxococcales bacterium]|nr:BMP family ABC transporter substrate-binding protein [Myxococcales bacterium]